MKKKLEDQLTTNKSKRRSLKKFFFYTGKLEQFIKLVGIWISQTNDKTQKKNKKSLRMPLSAEGKSVQQTTRRQI